MSVAEQIEALAAVRIAIRSAIITKGVAVPDGSTFADYAPLILAIEGTGPVLRRVVTAEGNPLVTADGRPVLALML